MYALFVVPWIDPKIEQKRIETLYPSQQQSNQRYDRLITEIFPEDDWIRGKCKILDAKQSVLFFKEAKQLEDGNWEVKPFTMFLNPDNALVASDSAESNGEKPIILRTEEGAYIKFEDGTSPNSPNGKFSGARMPGNVVVVRQESTPGAEDNFEFRTRNIQVNKKQILAVNPVRFKYGKHFGSGHNLTINLNGESKKKKTNQRVPLVKNLKTVELAHLEEIMLIPSPTEPQELSASAGNVLSKLEKSPVRVTCTGPFRLDFGKSKMVLFDEVHVEQLHASADHDHMYCDRLEVNFRFRDSTGEDAELKDVNAKVATEKKEKIKFQLVTAFGHPARLEVNSRKAYAEANRISYHMTRKIVHCRANVLLRDGEHQFQAPEIQYKLTNNNQLGTGWATGPGEIIGHPRDPDKVFKATWQSEFNIQPHEGKKAISLHGNAQIIFQNEKHFSCDELHFWIWEKRKRGPKPKWDFYPAQLLGRRNVSLNAPEFAGKVNEVRVFWPNPIGTIRSVDPNRTTKNSRTQGKLVSHPNGPKKTMAPKKPVENRIVGHGNVATAHLNRKNELQSFRLESHTDPSVSHRDVEPVHIESIDLTPAAIGQPPRKLIDVKGSDIQVDSTKEKDAYKVTVKGWPAIIEAEGIRFKAEYLTVDQSSTVNKAWTNVPGTVEIFPTVKNGRQPFGPEPKTTIYWNKKFEFDGWVLRLTDQVEFNGLDYMESGEQVTYEGKTQQLAARTNQFVNFRKSLNKKNTGNDPRKKLELKIQEFALLENAYVKSITRESIDEVKSIDELEAKEINVRTDTGDARAIGPGTIRSMRAGKKKQRQESNLIAGLASSSTGLSYMEVAFDGEINGNIESRAGTINENVRAVHGPAKDWSVRYDPDGTSIFGEEIYLNCDQMKFSQWRPERSKKPLVEIAAVGNTEIEGKKFRALASQLTYTEENEIVQMEGLQRTHARIWFRKNENQPWQYGAARKFRYQKSTSELVGMEDVKALEVLQFEAPNKRRR